MADLVRPQSLAVFPLPAGMLLLDAQTPESRAALDALVAGRLPQQWPDELAGHALAHQGDLEAAAAHFRGDDPISRFNAFVLAPEGVDHAQLRADLPADVAPLVDVLRYLTGQTDDLPRVEGTEGEIAGLITSTHASAALADGDAEGAVELLETAAVLCVEQSPALAALLRGNAGTLAPEHLGQTQRAQTNLQGALKALAGTDLTVAPAELHHQLGTVLHEHAGDGPALNAAVHHYYSALALVTEDSAPQLWASAHLSLGTAYLTMPMTEASDTLRTGIAMQSLRAALRVFTPEQQPGPWSAATLNLANALVYSPSLKQGDNVVEAIELYETVLERRDRDRDPVGRARVLANQGNALAHLGIFDQAKAKLFEARYIFEEHLDHDSAMMVRSVLDEIAKATVPEVGSSRSAEQVATPVGGPA